jgi:hypothetical protein
MLARKSAVAGPWRFPWRLFRGASANRKRELSTPFFSTSRLATRSVESCFTTPRSFHLIVAMGYTPIEGLNAIAWTMFSLDTVLTAGRFWLRWRKIGKIGWDDILNGIACVFLLGFMITYQLYLPITYNAELYALGLSDTPPDPNDFEWVLKMNVANIILFWCTIYTVKASFLALYYLIFNPSRAFRIAWWSVAAYTVLSFLITFLAVFWHCQSPPDVVDLGKWIGYYRLYLS